MDPNTSSESAIGPARAPIYDFDYVAQPGLNEDVHATYWRLKSEAPEVFWTPRNGGHWVVNSARAAISVLQRPAVFSNRLLSIPPNPQQQRMIPLSLDPPDHRPYRELLQPFFDDAAMRTLAPRVEEWANRFIDGVADTGRCEFVEEIGSRFPLSVFMEMMGFPLEELETYRHLVTTLLSASAKPEQHAQTSGAIVATLLALIEQRRSDPRDDLLSFLITAEFSGRRLELDELLSICFLMFLAGLDTVTNALAFGMRHLATDPALVQRMIGDPDCIPAVVEELLRRFAFVSTPRCVAADAEVAGVRMAEGDMVLVPLAVIGWDEKTISTPDAVVPDRPHQHHAAFGAGIHTCLGNRLARLELNTFYRTWLRRIGPFRLADGPPGATRGGSVWALHALELTWEKSHERRA